VDSNVIIGYIFDNADSQGKYAKIVIEDRDEKHSGQYVKRECFGLYGKGRCNTIRNEIAKEIRRVRYALDKGLSLEQILDQMEEKGCRTYIVVQDISKDYKSDILSLKEALKEGQLDFETDCIDREDLINKTVKFHDRYLPYSEIYDILSKSIEDLDDVEVIIDGHHVGLKISNLVLVSGNYRDITVFKRLICENTSLADVRSLKSFAPPPSFH